jgi:hypothetical protein
MRFGEGIKAGAAKSLIWITAKLAGPNIPSCIDSF